jgi:hypothetical protein
LTPLVGVVEPPAIDDMLRARWVTDDGTDPADRWLAQPPQGPPGGWGRHHPATTSPSHQVPWWRRAWSTGLIWGIIAFAVGAAAGGAGAEQEPRTVTVTSIVTSLVPVSTTTTEPPTTTHPETTATARATTTTWRPRPATTTALRRRGRRSIST